MDNRRHIRRPGAAASRSFLRPFPSLVFLSSLGGSQPRVRARCDFFTIPTFLGAVDRCAGGPHPWRPARRPPYPPLLLPLLLVIFLPHSATQLGVYGTSYLLPLPQHARFIPEHCAALEHDRILPPTTKTPFPHRTQVSVTRVHASRPSSAYSSAPRYDTLRRQAFPPTPSRSPGPSVTLSLYQR